MLAGTLKCGYCDSPFENIMRNPKKGETHRKRVAQCAARYQRKTKATAIYNNGIKCNSGYYSTADLEAKVIGQLVYLQDNLQALKDLISSHEEPEIDTSEFEKQLKTIENKISGANVNAPTDTFQRFKSI